MCDYTYTNRSYCFVLKLWLNNDDISVDGLVKGSKVSGPHSGLILLPVLWHRCSHLMLKCFIIFGEFQKFSCMFEGETQDRSKTLLTMKSSTKQGDDNLFQKECGQDCWSCVSTPWLTDHRFSEAKHTFVSSHLFTCNSSMWTICWVRSDTIKPSNTSQHNYSTAAIHLLCQFDSRCLKFKTDIRRIMLCSGERLLQFNTVLEMSRGRVDEWTSSVLPVCVCVRRQQDHSSPSN